MATFTKINDWLENMANGDVDMNADSFKLALSNTAPASETPIPTTDGNGIVANVTEIAYTNYTDDLTVDRVLEGVTSAQTAGAYKFDANDIVITASGGAIADFRYIYIFDDTAVAPADPLIGVWDNGAAISLADGSSATITIHADGLFGIT